MNKYKCKLIVFCWSLQHCIPNSIGIIIILRFDVFFVLFTFFSFAFNFFWYFLSLGFKLVWYSSSIYGLASGMVLLVYKYSCVSRIFILNIQILLLWHIAPIYLCFCTNSACISKNFVQFFSSFCTYSTLVLLICNQNKFFDFYAPWVHSVFDNFFLPLLPFLFSNNLFCELVI